MSDFSKEKINILTEPGADQDGLSQDKFAALFDSLDDEALKKMLDRAGLTLEDLADPEEPESNESLIVVSESPDPDEDFGTGDIAEVAADKDQSDEQQGLTPDNIAHLLNVLGDDIVMDMLESAGLTDTPDITEGDDPNASDQPTGAKPPADAPDVPAKEDPNVGKASKKKRLSRKGKTKRRFLFVLVFIGIIGLLVAANKIFMTANINGNDPIQYSEHTDTISADEGLLTVNGVSIKVPTDGTEEYSISYSWAEDDEEYPSVPHAITAIYKDQEEPAEGEPAADAGSDADNEKSSDADNGEDSNSIDGVGSENGGDTEPEEGSGAGSEESRKSKSSKLYSISLYRNETTLKADIPKKTNASNWFDSWTVVSEGEVLQEPLKSGDINGFYIYPQAAESEEKPSDYNDYSYYFAVEDEDGISVYVIEGVCLNEEKNAEFRSIMEDCIQSITIKEPGTEDA